MLDLNNPSYDWKSALEVSDQRWVTGESYDNVIGWDSVSSVLKSVEGENDGDSWEATLLLKDGNYAQLSAWCDDTGWDCRAGGSIRVAKTLGELINLCMSAEIRERLGWQLQTGNSQIPDTITVNGVLYQRVK